jgi:arylsulfatase A-like enzyme
MVQGCVLLIWLLAWPVAVRAAADRPNVLVLVSDDQRFDTIRALGNEQIQTPHLDRLVERGASFTRAFIMGSTVPAVCVPSRAMLLTGRTLFHAVGDGQGAAIRPGLALWPEVMGKAGYTTFGVGKWHNGPATFARSFQGGAAIFFGGMTDQTKVPLHEFDLAGKYPAAGKRVVERYSTEVFSDAAIEFLRGHKGDRPFFLYVAFTSPHDPRTPPAEFARMYDPAQIPLPANFRSQHAFDNGEMKVRDEQLAPWPRTPDVARRHIADYYGMISHLDAQIGRILGTLDETGHGRDTIVVFAGDNGLAVGQHGLMGKQNLYDHSVRVPLVMAGPGIPAGIRSDALCYLFDVFPTVCDLVGMAAPETVEGRSLAPALAGGTAAVRDAVFAAYRDVQRMVRTERWKLIRYPQVNKTQLFDLAADPDEIHDLADDAAHAGRVKELTGRLREWQKQVGDRLPLEASSPQTPHPGPLPAAARGRSVDTNAAVAATVLGPSSSNYDFDMAERRRHWAYQPVRPATSPAVRDGDWAVSPIDRFVLSRLEASGLAPARPADKRTLIRRVTFDLIGLPPTPDEVAAFLADESPDAYRRLVDRLLASPHYGERWARHWLDLVRYAETLGHEFDYEIFNTWRYRDYCIRALNADVPYDEFAVEHIAGDLVEKPRRHPTDRTNESVIGTGFFWLGEGKHSPVDVRQEQADRIDNQIDVLGKTFLAQTIACARCHDHKFDPIATRDYYALAGYLKSSRYQQAFLDAPERIDRHTARLKALRDQIGVAAADSWARSAAETAKYLMAARAAAVAVRPSAAGDEAGARAARDEAVAAAAKQTGLDRERLGRWVATLAERELGSPTHPFYAWRELSELGDAAGLGEFRARAELTAARVRDADTQHQVRRRQSELFDDFAASTFTRWFAAGDAFGAGPSRQGGELLVGPDAVTLRLAPSGWARSDSLARPLEGVLRSESFTIEKKFLLLRLAGHRGRVNVVVDGFVLIKNPIYGGLTFEVTNAQPAWRAVDLGMWVGHRAYIELVDSSTPNPTEPSSPDATAGRTTDSFIAVDEVRFSDDPSPPPDPPHPANLAVLGENRPDSIAALADRYQSLVLDAVAGVRSPQSREGMAPLLSWMLERGLVGGESDPLPALIKEYRQFEAATPAPVRAAAMADGTGEDESVFRRGNYKTLGELAPRQLLEVVAGPDQPPPRQGSGRLELARRMAQPTNPLFARVMVNRIWQHHFGTGLVATPDDFGQMGQPPTHPELLDYLATEFVRGGWSMKAMHRLMLLTSTYQMSSEGDPAAAGVDPMNRLLQHMPVRRLEAEAIRDAMLAVSGRLDGQMYGPSVAAHLTPFMEGRGRPGQSGPVDGDGRRSIYLGVRRNFLNPMFLAFDYPTPFTTIGRRSVSNVPAQALTLMNSPLAVEQAGRWAARLVNQRGDSATDRVRELYLAAFGRPPSDAELRDSEAFLDAQRGRTNEQQAWADLCHVVFNVKEFVFVP